MHIKENKLADSVIFNMSFTLSVTGCESILTTNYTPPLQLNAEYECGLLYFSTFNSIPNVDHKNNKFYIGDEVIEIPEGSYELEDISNFLESHVKDTSFQLVCNNNTLSTKIYCSKDIHFEKENSIGNILGFDKITLEAYKHHESHLPISILPTTIIRVECDIVSGSYVNGKPSHILYEFAPNVPPGFRIIEIPRNIIYFPVNQGCINSVNIKILDSNDNLVNLRKEEIQLYLHLKKK